MTRRDFLVNGGAAAAASAIPTAAAGAAGAPHRSKRLAIVGTGHRGVFTWGEAVKRHADTASLVGLCDSNVRRVKAAQGMLATAAPTFREFDRMVKETRPDAVLVTSVDSTHAHYIVRGLELGCDVISEKPLCTDEGQVDAILAAEKRSGKRVTVTFNARHSPKAKKIKQLLQEKAIGDLVSVDFHEYLDTSHGADYFRRWHYRKDLSGTLLVHKASHHFDLVNWWLDARPVEVSATGELKVYGKNGPFRGKNCRTCKHAKVCPYYWDVTKVERNVRLYLDAEKEDGYLRDACVFREDADTYDVMSVRVRYDSGVLLTYTANAFLPFEGSSVSFNGKKGRLDAQSYGGGGFRNSDLRLTRAFGRSEPVTDLEKPRPGGHGGTDTSLAELLFDDRVADPMNLKADVRAGALSSLVGIAAYRSIERGGAAVRIADLAKV